MWKTFKSHSKLYMLKQEEHSECLELYLADFLQLWYTSISKELLLATFNECNTFIEAKVDSVKSTLVTFLNELDNGTVITVTNITETELQIHIDGFSEALTKHIGSRKISYKFTLEKLPQEKFKEHVTVPLIYTVHCLEQQQKNLVLLLQKKDRELEEYRMEKGSISRDDLVTEKLDPKQITTSSEKLVLNVFGESKTFWEHFKSQNGDIGTDNNLINIEVEPWNSKPKKRKIYSSKTVAKKNSGIIFKK